MSNFRAAAVFQQRFVVIYFLHRVHYSPRTHNQGSIAGTSCICTRAFFRDMFCIDYFRSNLDGTCLHEQLFMLLLKLFCKMRQCRDNVGKCAEQDILHSIFKIPSLFHGINMGQLLLVVPNGKKCSQRLSRSVKFALIFLAHLLHRKMSIIQFYKNDPNSFIKRLKTNLFLRMTLKIFFLCGMSPVLIIVLKHPYFPFEISRKSSSFVLITAVRPSYIYDTIFHF